MKNKLKFLIAAVVVASSGSKISTANNTNVELESNPNHLASVGKGKKPMPILKLNNLQGDFTAVNSHTSHSSHRSHRSHFSHSSHRSGGMFI
jgi:hypothetical protein